MKILLNGSETEVPPGTTLAALLTERGFTGEKIAAAIGTRVIPRADWPATPLQENDKVTLISAVRGG